MTERGKDFADIVYTILVVEKTPKIETLAAALGMTYAALHSRLINRTCFSADEVRAIVTAVPDVRLVSYLLDGTKFVAAERVSSDGPAAAGPEFVESLQRGATRVVIEATDVLEIVDAALAGGSIDHRQETLILKEITETEQALASLRLKVRS